MKTIPRQYICRCCEDVCAAVCQKCVKDPSRKPRVLAIYDAPKILRINECGCVGFKCQRATCTNPKLVWRHLKSDGTLPLKNHYCSNKCAVDEVADARRTKVSFVCSCGCGRTGMKKPSEVRSKYDYFSHGCAYKHRKQLTRERKEAVRRALEGEDGRSLMQCEGKCAAVTEHSQVSRHVAKCGDCGAERDSRVKVDVK